MTPTSTKIRKARIKKGWSQNDLAREIRVSAATISLIENGKIRGLPRTIKAIADALEIPMEELLIQDNDAA
jgi:transcriptional regulator with XRE-family HTH domain